MAGTAARVARRALPGLTALALAACGGGSDPADPRAVAEALEKAAAAVGKGEGDDACAFLTDQAQTQIVLRTGGRLGAGADCSQAVGRATLFMSRQDRRRIKTLEATDIRITGDSATAVMRSTSGEPPIVVPLSVKREDGEWKVSGFGEDASGVPGF